MDTKNKTYKIFYKFKFYVILINKNLFLRKYYIFLYFFLGFSDFTHRYFRSLG